MHQNFKNQQTESLLWQSPQEKKPILKSTELMLAKISRKYDEIGGKCNVSLAPGMLEAGDQACPPVAAGGSRAARGAVPLPSQSGSSRAMLQASFLVLAFHSESCLSFILWRYWNLKDM